MGTSGMITFYHDIELDLDSDANPEICLQMVDEFLKIEKKYNISCTYNIVGSLFLQYPEMVEKIKKGGHDVAFHSCSHDPEWTPDKYSSEIEKCRDVDTRIPGYRSPRSGWNESTLEALWRNGFLWNAEKDDNPWPYFIYKNIVRLPIATDDWGVHIGHITLEEWVNDFRRLLDTKNYFGIGTHDFTFSKNPDANLKAYEKIIELAVERKTVIANFYQVADLYRRWSLSQYYTETGKKWNHDTKSLYRTKRFRELIRSVADNLDNPVIADLGSGGGVLSTPLEDISSKIYCVDNSTGMLDDVPECRNIKAVHGEVTDSTLPTDSVDFIICARVLEYITDPDLAADEIKRIGKMGAKFIITVPAYINSGPGNEGSAPDKLRKHFTAKEVIQWAQQIGPGDLIGVHYFQGEPKNEEDELRYRDTEKRQPEDLIPTNWVYIGTIENKQCAKPKFRTLTTDSIDRIFGTGVQN